MHRNTCLQMRAFTAFWGAGHPKGAEKKIDPAYRWLKHVLKMVWLAEGPAFCGGAV
jgi:hypothetical protein